MSHDIFQDRFYADRKPAWHNLGYVSQEDMTAVEAHQVGLKGGHHIVLRPVSVQLNGHQAETGDFAIIRESLVDDNVERVFGYTTGRYNPLQSFDIAQLFDEKVKRPVETMGMLSHGERMFLTWELPTGIIGTDDEVKYYGFIAAGFDAKMGIHLYVVSTRVVCANTWRVAIGEAEGKKNKKEEDKGVIFSGKHIMQNLPFILGEWLEHVQVQAEKKVALANNFFSRLAAVPMTESRAQTVLDMAFETKQYRSFVPPTLREDYDAKVDEKNEVYTRYKDGIMQLFCGGGTAITPNAWGLFNSTTEYFNFAQVEKKPMGMSVIDGNRAMNINRVTTVLEKEIK